MFGASRRAVAAARDVHAATAPADPHGILPAPPVPAYTIGVNNIPGLLGGWMSRDTAMMVPAFARGLDLITGVAAGFPLVEYDRDGQPMPGYGFTAQDRPSYEDGVPRVTTIRRTVADLVCEGHAYWYIPSRRNGYPERFQRISPEHVTKNELDGTYTIGARVIDATDVVEFDTGTPGALANGWYALRTAMALEAAANNYANEPLPSMALVSAGVDLDDTEAEALLTVWDQARKRRATAYLNSQVDTKEFGWNAAELQLTEARQHAAIEVARLLNLDPMWVGASPGGSSLTYQNRQDMNQSLLDVTILPLLRVIEQRLTMLSGSQRTFRFDTAAFLRANLGERVAALTQYVAADILTRDEARALEPIIKFGEVPA
jgi:HK97 family phage portal protein